jgi:hypothetical protein
MTSRTFNQRMGKHRNYVKRDVLAEPAGEHFNQRGHVADMKGQVLVKGKTSGPFHSKGKGIETNQNFR